MAMKRMPLDDLEYAEYCNLKSLTERQRTKTEQSRYLELQCRFILFNRR